MTREHLKRKFPNASEAFISANSDQAGGVAQGAVVKPAVRHEPVEQEKREARHAGRFHVRVVSFRRRLLDPDNLCPKYFIDCLRYAGLIPDDRAQDITLESRQEKVGSKAEERTEIEIIPIRP